MILLIYNTVDNKGWEKFKNASDYIVRPSEAL
jgi:hypothetical protein